MQLPYEITWRTARESGNRAQPFEVRAMTHGALRGLSAAIRRERLALLDTSGRNVSHKSRPRIAQVLCFLGVLGHFDYALSNRFLAGLRALKRKKQTCRDPSLRNGTGLNHANPRGPLHRREVLRRSFNLFVGHCLGESDHPVRIGLAGVGALSIVVLEVEHRLHEIAVGQPRHSCILWTTFPVRIVAEAARNDLSFPAATRDKLGHGGMVAGKPIGRPIGVSNLRGREGKSAAGKLVLCRVRGGSLATASPGACRSCRALSPTSSCWRRSGARRRWRPVKTIGPRRKRSGLLCNQNSGRENES